MVFEGGAYLKVGREKELQLNLRYYCYFPLLNYRINVFFIIQGVARLLGRGA